MAEDHEKPNGDIGWDGNTVTGSESPDSTVPVSRRYSVIRGENSATESEPEMDDLDRETEAGSARRIRKAIRSFGVTTDSDPAENGEQDDTVYPLLNRVRRVIRRFRITREGEDVY